MLLVITENPADNTVISGTFVSDFSIVGTCGSGEVGGSVVVVLVVDFGRQKSQFDTMFAGRMTDLQMQFQQYRFGIEKCSSSGNNWGSSEGQKFRPELK